MKNKIIKYWNYFYKNRIVSSNPTKFSQFCYKYLKNYKGILYDAGCGNGRDTIFFYRKNLFCLWKSKSYYLKISY